MESKFNQGDLVFVEEYDPKSTFNLERLHWHKAMVCDDSKFKIYVRVEGFEHIDHYDAKPIQVKVNKNRDLQHLKSKIAKEIKVNSNEFTIKRQGTVKELKDLKLSLMGHGITNGALMVVQKGTAHADGKYELEICMVTLLNNDDDKARLYHKKEQIAGTDRAKEETVFHKQFLGKMAV